MQIGECRERWTIKLRHLPDQVRGQPLAYFLHLGKSGGTALKASLAPSTDTGRYQIVLLPHAVRLADLERSAHYFFCVRDPVDRFVSGFLSRQRQGRPRYFVPWTRDEALAFSRFDSPDALGSALAGTLEQRAPAGEAMRSIAHVNRSYWYWFKDEAHLRRRAERLLWIGHQETLSTDIAALADALAVGPLTLPTDVKAAHIGSSEGRGLSEGARANLTQWYAADYRFLEVCADLRPARR
ncbi:MAG TPA: sulfotransferase family 2 domain-containing protein [Acidimicrobiales bacterium]|nr:sulfotransferase family 2 domain-containing protein [Acidimicrobiales bacterium]